MKSRIEDNKSYSSSNCDCVKDNEAFEVDIIDFFTDQYDIFKELDAVYTFVDQDKFIRVEGDYTSI